MKHHYTCQNEYCEHEFEVDFEQETPDSNAEVMPVKCPECSTKVDLEIVSEIHEEYGDKY
jgi:DNA-directed RNA polymerase subunit RPC12/RpoP